MGKLIKVLAVVVPLAAWLLSGQRFDPATVRGQRVLVTGASSGIGEQLAYRYARLGARLMITARRDDLLQDVSRTCEGLGAQEVYYVAADMADAEDRGRVVTSVQEHLGGLDHLVLNHALLVDGWWTGSAENLTRLELVYKVNFLSYADLASRALPMLVVSRGRIGIVSSGFGEIGTVRIGVYSACKFALHGFFASLRQELRYRSAGISVTLVVLGPVASDNMLDVVEGSYAHMPVSFMTTTADAAQAVIESVTLRRYKTYFDWKIRLLTVFNDVAPQRSEDAFAFVVLNDDRDFLAKKFFAFWRLFYSG